MALSSFMADDTQNPAQDSAPQERMQPVHPLSPSVPVAPLPTVADEDSVRLVLQLRTNPEDMLNAVDNGYSRDLQQRSQALTKYLQDERGPNASAVYLDPNEYTALQAMGMDAKGASTMLLSRWGRPTDDKTVNEVTTRMHALATVPGEGAIYTQDPHAILDPSNPGPQAGAIVPSSPYFPPSFRVEGLTHEQNLDFINRHEGWHQKDTQNLVPPQTLAQVVGLGDPKLPGLPAIENRQECLADTGAAGDMIRAGADPSIIPKIIAWREHGSELGHMTVGALEGLQKEINDMGLDKFRALGDADARALYQGIAEKGSIRPELAATAQQYLSGTAQERQALDVMSVVSPDTQAALDFLKPYAVPAPDAKPAGLGQAPLTPTDQELQRSLGNYHPAELLKDRAFSDSGKITPLTLAKAYGELQDELHHDLDRDPGNKLWQGQAQKLQQTFINAVQMTDYIQENAARGVDILKAEPLLKGLAPKPDETKPDAAKPDTTASAAPAARRQPASSM